MNSPYKKKIKKNRRVQSSRMENKQSKRWRDLACTEWKLHSRFYENFYESLSFASLRWKFDFPRMYPHFWPNSSSDDLVQNPENLESLVSIHKKDMEEDSVSIHKKGMEEDSVGSDTQKKKYNSSGEAELDSFVKCYLICPLRWYECLKQTMIDHLESESFWLYSAKKLT